jgi:pimeloyl-ACP methyl ester carboxylesterase
MTRFLLLHGLGATGAVWAGLVGHLGEAACAAPDLPGLGHNAHAENPAALLPLLLTVSVPVPGPGSAVQ